MLSLEQAHDYKTQKTSVTEEFLKHHPSQINKEDVVCFLPDGSASLPSMAYSRLRTTDVNQTCEGVKNPQKCSELLILKTANS